MSTPMHICMRMPAHMFVQVVARNGQDHRSIAVAMALQVHMPIHMPVHLPMHMSSHMPARMPARMPTHIPVHMSTNTYLCAFLHVYLHCAHVYTHATHAYACVPIRIYTHFHARVSRMLASPAGPSRKVATVQGILIRMNSKCQQH